MVGSSDATVREIAKALRRHVDQQTLEKVINDAVAVYFADAAIMSAFVARWCAGHKAEAADGQFRVREDEPAPRIGAKLHKTP